MRNLLYYPSFEIDDINWLKFALLSIGTLRPIVPLTGDGYIGELNSKIQEESNLLQYYRPNYEEGMEASLITVRIIKGLIENPSLYSGIFSTMEFDKVLRSEETHSFNLFKEKYIHGFKEFCLKEGLACETEEGMRINPILGNIYMTIFSNVIAEKNGLDCISDDEQMERYNIFSRLTQGSTRNNSANIRANERDITIARTSIDVMLPKRLDDINIDTIIEFRNRSNYLTLLDSFHCEINKYLDSVPNGGNSSEFIESLNTSKRMLISELRQLTPDIVAIGIGLWMAIDGELNVLDAVGTGSVLIGAYDSVKRIKSIYGEGQDARFTKKYLSQLRKLH